MPDMNVMNADAWGGDGYETNSYKSRANVGRPENVYDPDAASRSGARRSKPGCIATFEPGLDGKLLLRIMLAGDPKSVVVRRVNDETKREFAAEWHAYQNGRSGFGIGTPLRQWALMTPAMITLLNAAACYTIEDVANVSDASLSNLGNGGRRIRDLALDTVEKRDVAQRSGQVQAQMATMQQQLDRAEKRAEEASAALAMMQKERDQDIYEGRGFERDAEAPVQRRQASADVDPLSAELEAALASADVQEASADGKSIDDVINENLEVDAPKKNKGGRPRKTAE